MSPHDQVEEWIAITQVRTGLPMTRRMEIAQEWRGHLEQLIHDRLEQGLGQEQAVRSALQTFGEPDILRRQLRRTQRATDRRAALREVYGCIWVFTAAPAVIVAVLAVLFDRVVLWEALAAGLAFLALVSQPATMCAYIVVRARTVIRRERPRSEFDFASRYVMWTGVCLGTLTLSIVVSGFLIAAASPILLWIEANRTGWGQVNFFLQSFLSRVISTSIECEGLILTTLIVTLLAATAITVVERSNCIDRANEAEQTTV